MKFSNRQKIFRHASRTLLALGFTINSALARDSFPDISQLSSQAGWPDPLLRSNGQSVTSPKEWQKKRRPELKALFEHYMYGHMPPRPSAMKFSLERVDRSTIASGLAASTLST